MSLERVTVFLLVFLIGSTFGLRFKLSTGERQCLREEIHKNVVLTGEYEFSEAAGYTSSVHVSNFYLILKYSINLIC